jgi:hypothetical protein
VKLICSSARFARHHFASLWPRSIQLDEEASALKLKQQHNTAQNFGEDDGCDQGIRDGRSYHARTLGHKPSEIPLGMSLHEEPEKKPAANKPRARRLRKVAYERRRRLSSREARPSKRGSGRLVSRLAIVGATP